MNEGDSIVLINGVLRITYVINRRAAFGIGYGGDNADLVNRIIYLIIALVASVIIIIAYIKKFKTLTNFQKICLILILVGALGNCTDRLFYAKSGYAVVDFIDFYLFDFWTFVFNIADCGIVIGAFMLLGYLIVDEVKDVKKRRAAELQEINDNKNAQNIEQNSQPESNENKEEK